MDRNRLRGEIAAAYKTQKAFSDAIGWHKNKVSKLLCGGYQPDIDEAAEIAAALRLDEAGYLAIFLPRRSPNGEQNGERSF